PLETLRDLSERLLRVPEGFEMHPRVAKIMDDRRKMAAGALPLDWGFAENLAYASLLEEGYLVRISGQDCGRGTFFHRHSVLHNQKDGSSYTPLMYLHPDQPTFLVIDSILSEEAVLGFEYGYSTAEPNSLVIWEGQFGDFANGAQVVIDQFITSGEAKWGRLCGLVLMLPHGFEGQGPEHSSARLERYLQLCAQENIQVCVPTLPAQMFHLLRRQIVRPLRKPLVILTPKSLLRNPVSTSSLADLASGAFHPVIDDPHSPRHARRVVACSGRVWFDLQAARTERGLEHVALVRVEQLYPFPEEAFRTVLNHYPQADTFVWSQEVSGEPGNVSGTSPQETLNLDNLYHISGGDKQFVRQMLVTFIDTTDRGLREMHEAGMSGEWESVGEISHRLLPPCRHIGADELSRLLAGIGESIRNKADTGKTEGLVKESLRVFEKVREQLLNQIKEIGESHSD
ncbi:MAG: hypothetical protein R6W81_09800, partial [Bacteroidales bacterium]